MTRIAASPPYNPPWWLRSGHTNTIYSFLRQRGVVLPPARHDWLRVADEVELLLASNWQPGPAPALLLVHGLEGSSEAGYMQTTASLALDRGMHVVRMNVRNCGASEPRCNSLYNSGMSDDVGKVLAWVIAQPNVRSVALGGFSMGGNMVLKYAGQTADRVPPQLTSVAAISPCLDLAPSADGLNRRPNFLYQRRFVKSLKRRLIRHAARHPGRYPIERFKEIRSVRDFDEIITAPFTGYKDADDYYTQASAANWLADIQVPTLVLHAADDPFIVITPASRAKLEANPNIHFVETQHGGHCAFINHEAAPEGVYWGENRLVDFSRAGTPGSSD